MIASAGSIVHRKQEDVLLESLPISFNKAKRKQCNKWTKKSRMKIMRDVQTLCAWTLGTVL